MSAEGPPMGDPKNPNFSAATSPLANPKERHQEITLRTNRIRDIILDRGYSTPPEHTGDQHFWYNVSKNYFEISKTLRNVLPEIPVFTRQHIAIKEAIRDGVNATKADKEKLTDDLTGAWSRGALDNKLENLRFHGGMNTAVLMIDIDFFKEVNDTHGHPYGDEKLKALVGELQNNTRGIDLVGRYGGEEFAVIMPDIQSLATAVTRAETIRRKVSEKIDLTVSMGVTLMGEGESSIANVWHKADQGLYAAKHLGRNRVCLLEGSTLTGETIVHDASNNERFVLRQATDKNGDVITPTYDRIDDNG